MTENMSEYSALRDELVANQERKASVWLHMYILYLSLFVLGFEISYYMFLLTFIVIIPYQQVINNLEWNVSRISAYIRIFYEGKENEQRWETMNTQYGPYLAFLNKKFHFISRFVRKEGSIHLGLLSMCFFIYNILLQNKVDGKKQFCLSWWDAFLILAVVILFVIVIVENQEKYSRCENELISIMNDYKKDVEDKKI